jgi:hypothetical protein
MTLEAQRRGLITHDNGGFSVAKAREAFYIPEDYDLLCVVASDITATKLALTPEHAEREKPGARKEVSELLLEISLKP